MIFFSLWPPAKINSLLGRAFLTVPKVLFLQLYLMTCDAKFIACLEKFSSKFNYPMIKNFGTVNPVFQQAEITELLRSKMRSSFGANLVSPNLE